MIHMTWRHEILEFVNVIYKSCTMDILFATNQCMCFLYESVVLYYQMFYFLNNLSESFFQKFWFVFMSNKKNTLNDASTFDYFWFVLVMTWEIEKKRHLLFWSIFFYKKSVSHVRILLEFLMMMFKKLWNLHLFWAFCIHINTIVYLAFGRIF